MSSPSGSQTTASPASASKGASPASSDRSVHTPTLSLERSGSSTPAPSDRSFSTAIESSQKSPRARPPARPPQAPRKEPTTSTERNTANTRSTTYPCSTSSARSTSGAGPSHARDPLSSRQTTARDAKTTPPSHEAKQIHDQLLHAKCKLLIYQTSISQAHPGTDTGDLRRQVTAQEARIDELTRRFDAAVLHDERANRPAPYGLERRIAEIMRKHRHPGRRLAMLKKELTTLWDFLETEEEESSDGPGWIQQLNKAIREQDALIAAMGPAR